MLQRISGHLFTVNLAFTVGPTHFPTVLIGKHLGYLYVPTVFCRQTPANREIDTL